MVLVGAVDMNLWPLLSLALALGLWLQTLQLHQAQDRSAKLEQEQQLAWVQTKNLEARYRNDIEQKDQQTRTAITAAHAAAARARAASASLQHDLADFIEAHRQRAQAAAAAGQCETNDTASVVLTQLFRGADDVAGELAAALDESRARGKGCEAIYDTAVKQAD